MRQKAIVRTVQTALKRKLDVPQTDTGIVGDGAGRVDVEGKPGYVWVRIHGRPSEVLCSVPVKNDLPVICGRDVNQPGSAYQVLRARYLSYSEEEIIPAIITSNRFRWFFPGGGQDPLYVELRQFMPLRPTTNPGQMLVTIERGWFWSGTNFVYSEQDNVDLTSLNTWTPPNNMAWVLITLSTTGVVIATKGTAVPALDLPTTPFPAPPAGTAVVLAAVRMYEGMTAVNETRTNTDLIDLRFSGWGLGGGGGGGALNDLTDVTITGPTDSQVLTYSGGSWINSAASAGVDTLDELTDVVITAPALGQALRHDGTNWINAVVADPSKIVLVNSDGTHAVYAATTAGLVAALAASGSGDTVLVPPIVFTLSSALSVPAGVSLVGAGVYMDWASGTIINGQVNAGVGAVLSNLFLQNDSSSAGAVIALNVSSYCYLYRCHLYAGNSGAGAAYAMEGGSDVDHFGCQFEAWSSGASANPFHHGAASFPGGRARGSWCEPAYLNQFDYTEAYYGSDRACWDITDTPGAHASDIQAGSLKRHLPAPAAAGRVSMDNGTAWVSVQTLSAANVSSPPTAAELATAFGTVPAGFRGFVNDAGGGVTGWEVVYDGTNWWYTAMTKAA